MLLAFALPAWLLARQRRWEPAALCAVGACCVRVTGIFLVVALIGEFLIHDRRWRFAPLRLMPFVPVLAYTLYQWRRTGDWLAWQHAQLFFSSRRRHTRCGRDWSSDVCSSDLDSKNFPLNFAPSYLLKASSLKTSFIVLNTFSNSI